MKPLSIHQRAALYNRAYANLSPLSVHLCQASNYKKPFLYGIWFLGGGGNVSGFYGSYSNAYLDRILSMFPDAERVLHLFAGSMPASSEYLRCGLDPTGEYKYEIKWDAEQLSSCVKVRNYQPDLIFADPPYSVEDMQHYKNEHLVNRPKVVSECAAVLAPGGYLVWLDQVLPVFSNDELSLVGIIGYIRSTGNRFRCINIFQKPQKGNK